ncbi:Spy/CpxP family protein refolding chaperone [Undibacterium sp.]|uniref:Spy/CpxP family protein refolding chaperone n=1 Tax=Undibacterium sp. TaxID=1914977 RepID=UPI0037518EEE
MKFLKNTIVLGLTTASLVLVTGAYAQQAATPASAQDSARSANHAKMIEQRQQRMQAGMEKHRTQLHDKLKLTPQQEPAWKAFTEATRPQHDQKMHQAKADRQAMAALSAPARMEKMLERSKERLVRMQQHLDALKSFYAVLTPEQQKIFDASHQGMRDRMKARMKMRMHDGMQKRMQNRMHDGKPMRMHEGQAPAPTTK